MAAPIQNKDGLTVKLASYWQEAANFVNRPHSVTTFGNLKQIEFDVDLTKITASSITYTSDLNNDGTRDGFNTGDIYLPAYASVKEVVVLVKEAAAGGTSIKLGTFTLTGTEIDDDGLITATEGVKANLDTIGARTYGAGAYVATTAETASVGSTDAYLAFTGAGTWTAGKLKVIVSYYDTVVDS